MSKLFIVADWRKWFVDASKQGAPIDELDVEEFEAAVRAEAEERVYKMLEEVLESYVVGGTHGKLYAWPPLTNGQRAVIEGKTAREAILAAAKELGINTEEVESCQE